MTDRRLLVDFAKDMLPRLGRIAEVAAHTPPRLRELGAAARALSEVLRRRGRRGLGPCDLIEAGALPADVWRECVAVVWNLLRGLEETPGTAARRVRPAFRELAHLMGPPGTNEPKKG